MNNSSFPLKKGIMKQIDIYGRSISLYTNGDSEFKTNIGGFFTICTLMLSILCFIAFGRDLIERKNPSSLNMKEYVLTPSVERGKLGFYMAPHFDPNEGHGKQVLDVERKLQFLLLAFNVSGTKENLVPFMMTKCKNTKDFQENKNSVKNFTVLPEEDYWCPPDEFNQDLWGKFGQSNTSFYAVLVGICNNATTNNNCLPREEIEEEMKKVIIHFMLLDNYIDVTDYEDSVKSLVYSNNLQSSSQSTRYDYFYLKNVDIITDSGWIMQSEDINESFQLDNAYSMVEPIKKNFFFNALISMNNLKDIYKRRYVKFQEVLANFGGLIKACMWIFVFTKNLIVKRILFQDVYYEYLNKHDKYNNGNDLNDSSSNIMKTKNNIIQNNYIKPEVVIPYTNMNLNGSVDSNKSGNKKINNLERLTNKELLCGFLLCRNNKYREKKKILSNIDLHIRKNLEVTNLIALSAKIKLLNSLIFDQDGKIVNKAVSYHWILKDMDCKRQAKIKNKKTDVGSLIESLAKIKSEERKVDFNKNLSQIYMEIGH